MPTLQLIQHLINIVCRYLLDDVQTCLEDVQKISAKIVDQMLDALPSGQTTRFVVGGGVPTSCTVKACGVIHKILV